MTTHTLPDNVLPHSAWAEWHKAGFVAAQAKIDREKAAKEYTEQRMWPHIVRRAFVQGYEQGKIEE